MNIRPATDADLMDVFFLFIREYRETRAEEAGLKFTHGDILLKFILMIKQPEYGVLLVAEENEMVMGYIYGPYQKGWGAFDGLVVWKQVGWFVKKEHRGEGVEAQLLEAAETTVAASSVASHIMVTKLTEGYKPIHTTYVRQIREG